MFPQTHVPADQEYFIEYLEVDFGRPVVVLGKNMSNGRPRSTEYFTEEAARTLLGPLEETFLQALLAAWTRYQQAAPALLALPSNILRATVMHEMSVDELTARLDGNPGVRVVPAKPGRRRAFFVLLSATGAETMVIQVKKLDEGKRPTNIGTMEATRFNCQASLPGIPNVPRVTIGYSVVQAGTAILVEAVYWRNGATHCEWSFELGTEASVEQLPLWKNTANPAAAKKGTEQPGGRVRAKGDRSKQVPDVAEGGGEGDGA